MMWNILPRVFPRICTTDSSEAAIVRAVSKGTILVTIPTAIHRLEPTSSLRGAVERSMSAAIIAGEFIPGALVSVPSLAGRFGVSATPVREAMLNLEKRGFVEPVKNKGFRVTNVSEEDLREIVQVRQWLEAPPMRIVSVKLTQVNIEPYRKLANQIISTAEQSDMPGHLAADTEFHLALLRLTENERLVELVAELRKQTRRLGLDALGGRGKLLTVAHEHHDLLDMLVKGRGIDAEKLMIKHIGHVAQLEGY